MTQTYLKSGLVTNSSRGTDVKGGFHLERWLKKVLDFLHITVYDDCCDSDSIYRPVRYNTDDEVVEFFDGTNWTAIS